MCDPDTLSANLELPKILGGWSRLLCGVGLVVHEEELEVADVVDQESLVAGRHHVAGLAVVAIADLNSIMSAIRSPSSPSHPLHRRPLHQNLQHPRQAFHLFLSAASHTEPTHLWHSNVALKPPPDTVVDTLGLPPAGVDAFEAIALVAVEARRALLQDRDVALCGDHLLCRVSLQSRKIWAGWVDVYPDCIGVGVVAGCWSLKSSLRRIEVWWITGAKFDTILALVALSLFEVLTPVPPSSYCRSYFSPALRSVRCRSTHHHPHEYELLLCRQIASDHGGVLESRKIDCIAPTLGTLR